MPTAQNRDVTLHYETIGDGDTVVWIPDLGCGAWLWSWQVPALAGGFECIVFDPRGAGQSDSAEEYSIHAMAADVDAILAEHDVRHATLVGAGLGGMVALAYAGEYTRSNRLVLLGTAANGERFDGTAFLGGPDDLDALLSLEFREELPEEVRRIADWREAEDAPHDVRHELASAVGAIDADDWLHEIVEPALVLHGETDQVVSIEAGQALADGLPRGEYESFADGSHFFFIEQARLVNDSFVGFLERDV